MTKKFANNDKLKQFAVLAILALVLVGAERIGAATTWVEPSAPPPSGSITSPITIGVSSTTVQVMQGKLSMDTLGVFGNALIQKTLVVGTTSSASLSGSTTLLVDGSVAAGEYCDTSGSNCFTSDTIINLISDANDGVVCPSTPAYSSMKGGFQGSGYYFNFPLETFGENGFYGASSYGSVLGESTSENRWDKFSIPSTCSSSDEGCIIRQKVYKRYAAGAGWSGWYQDKLYAIRDYEYRQDSSASATSEPLWWSSYQTKGTYKNGDAISSNIIKPVSYLYLRDDADVTVAEKDNDKFSAYDLTRSYGFEIYFCTDGGTL